MEDASSKKEQEEDHTREIEIETAFKTFQEAIGLKKRGSLVESYLKFKELAKFDVIVNHYYEETAFLKGLQNGGLNTQTDELSYISQNVKTIRYLYFRNRGFLYFKILQTGAELIEKVLSADLAISEPLVNPPSEFEFTKELFYSMMDDLANCFIYQEVDELLLRLLYDVYVYMDTKKLARYTLEYARTTSAESDDILGLLPLNDWADSLWEKFEENGLTEHSVSDKLSERLLFLKPMKDDLHQQIMGRYLPRTLEVPIKDSTTWNDVIQSLNSSLKACQDKDKAQETAKCGLKHLNPQLLTDGTIDKVEFVFPGEVDVVVEEPVDLMEVDTTETPEVTANGNDDEDTKADRPIKDETELITDVKPEEDAATPVPATSSAKIVHRSSRRLKPEDANPYEPDDIQLTRHYYVETEAFFDTLNTIFKEIFVEDTPALKDVVAYIVDDAENGNPLHIKDFVSILNDWNRRTYTPIILLDQRAPSKETSKADGEKLKLMDVLTQFGNQFSSDSGNSAEILDDFETPDLIKSFLTEICSESKSMNEMKIELLSHLMGNSNNNLIMKAQWDSSTYSAVREWVLTLEPEILNSWISKCRLVSNKSDDFEFATSIYEMLVDFYIQTKNEIDRYYDVGFKGSKSKSNLNANSLELLRLDDRLSKWDLYITQTFLNERYPLNSREEVISTVRFLWASNYRLASKSFTWKEKKHVVENLNELAEYLQTHSGTDNLRICLPNFTNLGDFSRETLHRRLSTASILSIFSKILYTEDHKGSDSSEDTISLLENILIGTDQSDMSMDDSQLDVNSLVNSVINGKAALDEHSLRSVRDFLDECPIELKLSLWNILFLYYEEVGSYEKFQNGLEHNLAFVLEYWESLRYKNTTSNRALSFLTSLSFYRGYLNVFLQHLAAKQWILPIESTESPSDMILNLLRIFEICYVFSLHEEAALITGNKVSLSYRSEAAFNSFKDFFIDSITIILVYCVNYLRGEQKDQCESVITRLLRLVHQQLGLRRLCDASNGIFLRFSEYTLVGMEEKPNIELAQLLSCRFHFKVKIHDQYPIDHYTTKVSSLDKASATELASFVLPLCFRNNPIVKAPRNDMKQVLDDLMEVIGDPDIEGDSSLIHNNATLEKFIDTSTLTARFIKDCFYGLTTIELIPPESDSRVALNGLYFLQAVSMFNSYKIRKKSAQSRTVELERIIRLLKDDLMHRSERVESWLLLGQAYGYIVEDDLIWTSDKLNIVDRKVVTANLQRMSLVCYIMAINTMTRKGIVENDSSNLIIGILMNSFVKELYGAVRIPMDMIAFKVRNTYKFVRKRNQTMFQTVSDKPTVPMKFCLKLMQRCLQLSIKSNASEWSSFYYLGKVMAKLEKDPADTLSAIMTSCKLSQTQGTAADPLLESAYKLISLLYKYVRFNKLTVESAVQYLTQEPLLGIEVSEPVTDKAQFYKLLITALQKLITLDKKGWYHKPCYRMAVIEYDEFDDYKKAREIMNKFFSLKASNKTFLQMWKPENERPGKHFVYMFYYTQFFIKILRRELDLSSLIQILPKLRKANSTMVLLYFAWENVCSSICKLIRVISDIEENFVELCLYKHSQNSFAVQAKTVVETIKEKGIQDSQKPLFCYLQVITEMRKLNNGFGPTSLIDDTICAVFLRIFNGIAQESAAPQVVDLTAVKFKRLAKRDLFPFINEITAKCKRDVDSYLKDDPEIFNTYVTKFIEHKRHMTAQAQSQPPPSNGTEVSNGIQTSTGVSGASNGVSSTSNEVPVNGGSPVPTAIAVHAEVAKDVQQAPAIGGTQALQAVSNAPPPTVFATRPYNLAKSKSPLISNITNQNRSTNPPLLLSQNESSIQETNQVVGPVKEETSPEKPGTVFQIRGNSVDTMNNPELISSTENGETRQELHADPGITSNSRSGNGSQPVLDSAIKLPVESKSPPKSTTPPKSRMVQPEIGAMLQSKFTTTNNGLKDAANASLVDAPVSESDKQELATEIHGQIVKPELMEVQVSETHNDLQQDSSAATAGSNEITTSMMAGQQEPEQNDKSEHNGKPEASHLKEARAQAEGVPETVTANEEKVPTHEPKSESEPTSEQPIAESNEPTNKVLAPVQEVEGANASEDSDVVFVAQVDLESGRAKRARKRKSETESSAPGPKLRKTRSQST